MKTIKPGLAGAALNNNSFQLGLQYGLYHHVRSVGLSEGVCRVPSMFCFKVLDSSEPLPSDREHQS